jgi:hypothetical protein
VGAAAADEEIGAAQRLPAGGAAVARKIGKRAFHALRELELAAA